MTARLAIVAALAAALLVSPALASEVDPKALVLGERDVPKGFRIDPSESGVRTNALEAKEHPESRAPFQRMRRVIGYQALYARGESRIEARSDLFRDAAGARDFLLLTEREWRKSGAKGIEARPGRSRDRELGLLELAVRGRLLALLEGVVRRVGHRHRQGAHARTRARATAEDRCRPTLGRRPLRLVLDPDPVGHAGHVVEVADDLDRVRDRRVVEAVRAECVDVRLVDLRREVGQLDGELAQSALPLRQLGLAPVVRGVSC